MSDTAFETPGVLDLSDADTSGFDAVDSGRYNAEVWELKWVKTKSDSTGAYGPDWPYLNLQDKITDEPFVNRRVFGTFFPKAPAGYDPTKAAKSKGAFVNFLVALGYEEAEVKSPSFTLDLEALKGKPHIIIVSKEPKKDASGTIIDGEFQNRINGYKRAGESTATGATSVLL